jgi:hypothetical protein
MGKWGGERGREGEKERGRFLVVRKYIWQRLESEISPKLVLASPKH